MRAERYREEVVELYDDAVPPLGPQIQTGTLPDRSLSMARPFTMIVLSSVSEMPRS